MHVPTQLLGVLGGQLFVQLLQEKLVRYGLWYVQHAGELCNDGHVDVLMHELQRQLVKQAV